MLGRGSIEASSSGNSPATKQVTASKLIPAPVVGAAAGGSVGNVLCCTSGAGAAGSGGGSWPGSAGAGAAPRTAAGRARRSIRAEATWPATIGTYAGALLTTRPAWFSVASAYWPGASCFSKAPPLPEVVLTTAPVWRSINAISTPVSGRPASMTVPWTVPREGAAPTGTGGAASRATSRTAATLRMARPLETQQG